MEHIVTEIAATFIKNMVEILSDGINFENIEAEALRTAKDCAAKMIGAYAEFLNSQIVSDKASRRAAG